MPRKEWWINTHKKQLHAQLGSGVDEEEDTDDDDDRSELHFSSWAEFS